MNHHTNAIQNNILASLTASAPGGVVNAIKKASVKTGVNFAYLVQQADVESSFNPKVKAKTSSASGLYQFIESTWLNMVKKHGDKYGMGELASKISDSGKVASKAVRKEILALRNDPEKASVMAAEFARENEQSLKTNWGGEVGSTELYLAHFLGAGQASAFLRERDENPAQQAALIFPTAARANRNVFYDQKTGRPRSMEEVYAFFDKKFDIKDMENTAVPNYAPEAATQNRAIASNVFLNNMNNSNEFYTNTWRPNQGSTYNQLAYQQLANPVDIMLLSQMDSPLSDNREKDYSFRLND